MDIREEDIQQREEDDFDHEEVANQYSDLNDPAQDDLVDKIKVSEGADHYDDEEERGVIQDEVMDKEDSEERLMNYAKDLNIPIDTAEFEDEDEMAGYDHQDAAQQDDDHFGYMDYNGYDEDDIQ